MEEEEVEEWRKRVRGRGARGSMEEEVEEWR